MTKEEKRIITDFLDINYKNNYELLGDTLTSNTKILPVDKIMFIYTVEKLRKAFKNTEPNDEKFIRTRKGKYNQYDDSIPENKREVVTTKMSEI